MKKIKFSLMIIFMALFFASCEKNKNELPVELEFRLLDTMGIEKTVFNHGENIIFSLKITNLTNSDKYLKHHEINLNNFFRVIQLNLSEGRLDYGKPFEHIFCEYIGGVKIPGHNNVKIEIPWLWNKNQNYQHIGCPNESYHANTDTLPAGNYSTSFLSSFIIDNMETEEKYFEIKFTVK